MKIVNIGSMSPVAVVVGTLDIPLIKACHGYVMGTHTSTTVQGQLASWLKFETDNDLKAFCSVMNEIVKH